MIGRGRDRGRSGGFLTRLAQDRGGNTLAMMAVAMIPLLGMAGSAIDTARVYYVKVRLQQACDAGALAGRKFMNGNDFNDAANSQARAFFANNFQTGSMGSEAPVFTPVKTAAGQVAATASVTVPMTVMRMAGFEPVTVSVACEARLEIPNLDIMFVLDTTGSMTETNVGDSADRITGLRQAVMNFYDTLDRAKKPGTEIRYGAVPYSANVNVGMLLRPEWMVDKADYQSRRYLGPETTKAPDTVDNADWVTTAGSWQKKSGSIVTSKSFGRPEDCSPPASTVNTSQTDTTWKDAGKGNGSQTITYTRTRTGSAYSTKVVNARCEITETSYRSYVETRTDTRVPNPNKGQTKAGATTTTYWWSYESVNVPVSRLKGTGARISGGSISMNIAAQGKSRTITWNQQNGCIEERKTVLQSTYDTIPSDAYDLNIDMVPDPSNDDTRWKPWLPAAVFARESFTKWSVPAVRSNLDFTNLQDVNSGQNAPCPSPAKLLQAFTRTDLQSYVNSLIVGGKTHHDIGFLWGLRLMSRDGIFGDVVNTGLNGAKNAQHLIFMTDGETDTDNTVYEAYGLSGLDRRRTTSFTTNDAQNNEQDTIVVNRLLALCQVARRKDITVWVIAFGTTMPALLSNCTTEGRSFEASNTAQLNAAFTNIAAQIAKLRVSK